MRGNTGVTQPSLPLVDTLAADLRCLLAACFTRYHGRIISGQHLDGFSLPCTVALCHHPQPQLCCGAEIVLVGTRHLRAQELPQGNVHAARTEFSGSTGNVGFAIDKKLTHVPTALEPEGSEKRVEGFEGGIGAHFEVQPIWRIAFHHEVQQCCPTRLSWIRWQGAQGLPGLACPQVSGHGGFADGRLAKATGACRDVSGHMFPLQFRLRQNATYVSVAYQPDHCTASDMEKTGTATLVLGFISLVTILSMTSKMSG